MTFFNLELLFVEEVRVLKGNHEQENHCSGCWLNSRVGFTGKSTPSTTKRAEHL